MRPPVINILPSAHLQLEGMFSQNPTKSLLVYLSSKGCGGHSYEFAWIDDAAITKVDDIQSLPYGKLVIRGDSILNLLGSSLDWIEDVFESKFVWSNPHTKSICGCGKSVGF